MRGPEDKLIAGIDLHSNNLVIGVINQDGQRVSHRKLGCNLKQVVDYLKPFKSQLQSLAVESTFNGYWLVDGLRAHGYPIDLANPAKIEQYSGIKCADDENDAYHLAELQRLNILPKAYVYDPLGMTITMEVGEIQRFQTDGDFASYCRAVDSRRLSNGKQKAELNERGPALNVFWISALEIGREASVAAACQQWGGGGKNRWPRKPSRRRH